MNHWEKVWNRRADEIKITDDIFETFCQLKSADGYDIQLESGYYESFYREFLGTKEKIEAYCGEVQSAYEVGCGSGVNLYLFQKLMNVKHVGGLDYSRPLLEIANRVLPQGDFCYGDALELSVEDQYDVLMSEAVLIYFQSAEDGMRVLEKMYEKAKKMVVVKEIFDLAKKDECMKKRRESVPDYDEKYKDLEKIFYARESFIRFAEERGCTYEIVEPQNTQYWNNPYVFDFYLYKKEIK